MRKPINFRARVMWLATGMGLLLSLLFAVAVVVITERYEHVLVGALLQDQADAWAERLAQDPNAVLASSDRQRVHLRPLGGKGELPAHLAHLSPGVHESEGASDGLHIGVFDTDVGRIYLEIDLRDIESLEKTLLGILLGVAATGALVSALLGWWLSRSATRPLRRLAHAVEQLDATPQVTHLAATQARDELGRLALAIDGYQQRLMDAQDNERAFFADASHELRTPVAVVRGALELLEEDVRSQPALQAPMQRLRRGVDEFSTLIDALLRLARRQLAPLEPVDVDAWLPRLLTQATRDRSPPVHIAVHGQAGVHALPLRDAELVVSALLRSMLARRNIDILAATLSPQGIKLHAQAQALSPDHARPASPHVESRSDRRFGASLIGRLAIAQGWRIEVIDDATVTIHWANL